MSALSDAILALNPVRYGRCDELVSGPLTDSSTFAVHGTTEPLAVFGLPSAIETDPASSSIGGPVGRFPAAAGSEADMKGNFTWLFFIFYDAANPSGMAVCRSGQFGVNGVFAGINSNQMFATVRLVGEPSAFTLTGAATLVDQTWYMVAVARNGVTFSMYVEADLSLGATRSDLTGADVDYNVEGTDWFLGRSVNTTAFSSTRLDEVALFNVALTQPEIAGVLAAARNSLSLNGYSNVVSSAVLYSGVEPTPISFAAMRHNWQDDLIERISFTTGVSTAIKGYEQGNGQRIKPRREIEISQMLRNDVERRAFRAKLNTQQSRKWFIPILEDRTRLTTAISSGVSVFAVDTLYRDYEIGGYLGIRQLNDAGTITLSEELLITGLTNIEITTSTPTVNEYTTPELYPVRRAIINESASLRGHTDSVEDTTILARLIAEDEKVVPHRIVEWTPTTTYLDYEVFPVELWPNNWAELRDYKVERVRPDVDFDLGSFIPQSDSIGASETFSWRIILQTKQAQAEFLGWFYARTGSLNYLWVPTMQRDFDIVDADGVDLTVGGHNYSENYVGSEYRRDIAFVYNDNSVELRRIESVALDGANEILTLDTVIPTLTNLRSVSYLLFCRLDNDTIEIARATDTKAAIAWLFREILSSPE